MEAKDLMIGDKLKTVFSQKIVEVKEIKQSCIYIEGNAYEYNEIEPIPLTSEILEKNGFVEKRGRRWVLSDEYTGDEVLVLYEVAKGFAMPTSGLTIGFQNVHELQHLLKLCGMNKEIEL